MRAKRASSARPSGSAFVRRRGELLSLHIDSQIRGRPLADSEASGLRYLKDRMKSVTLSGSIRELLRKRGDGFVRELCADRFDHVLHVLRLLKENRFLPIRADSATAVELMRCCHGKSPTFGTLVQHIENSLDRRRTAAPQRPVGSSCMPATRGRSPTAREVGEESRGSQPPHRAACIQRKRAERLEPTSRPPSTRR